MEKCPICKTGIVLKVFDAHPQDYSSSVVYPISKCSDCGCGFTGNAHIPEGSYEAGSYDAREKFWHKMVRPLLNVFERDKVKYVSAFKKAPASVLEIGTGKGNYLSMLQKADYDVHGIEPSLRSFSFAKSKLGNRVQNCMLEDIYQHPSLNKKYDVIVMWHVLEHLRFLESILDHLKRLLDDNGILVIAVPNFESAQSKFGKADWYHLDPSRHGTHFTPLSLSTLFKGSGFSQVEIFFDDYYQSIMGELVTDTNKMSPYTNILLNTLRSNRFYFKKVGPLLILPLFIYSSLLHVFLLLPSVAISFVMVLRRKAASMVVVFMRKE